MAQPTPSPKPSGLETPSTTPPAKTTPSQGGTGLSFPFPFPPDYDTPPTQTGK